MPLTREERHEHRKQKIAQSRKEAKTGLKFNEKRLSQAASELENLHLLHKLLHHFQSRIAGLPDNVPLVFGRDIPLTGGVLKKLFPKGVTKGDALVRLAPCLARLLGKKAALCEEIDKLEQIASLHGERVAIADQLKTLHQEKIKAEKLKLKLAEKKRVLAEKKRERREKERQQQKQQRSRKKSRSKKK